MNENNPRRIFISKWPQLVAVITGTLGTISDGMHYGWTAPMIPKLLQPDSPISITQSDQLWIENILMIGALVGLILTIIYSQVLGRRPIIILAAVKQFVAWSLIATTSRVEVLYFARFLAGVAGNIPFVTIPMYIAEIAEESVRGFLETFIYTNMMVGVVIIYCIAPFTSVSVSSCVGATCATIQIISFSFMPESPYYLLIKDNYSDALKSLQTFRGKADVYVELNEIRKAVRRQESEEGRIIDLFLIKSNRKAFLINCVLNFSQHFAGISVLLMNLHTILEDAHSIIRPSAASIIIVTVMLAACISSSFVIDKLGRKKLLVSSSMASGIALFLLATYFALKKNGYNLSHYEWVPLVAVLLYSWCFKFGLGMVPIVLSGELFPTKMKAVGTTFGVVISCIFCMLSVFLYVSFIDFYGMHVPFFVFSGCCAITALFAIVYIPETKGKTLEEIQMILKS
ncbi:facilitated trehalose transporter Tret1-like [Agrilus planipennis]|uniref:Facilitated trehalose transporter Tret1-like n=1 Tax=Agrilus planipennis TaxID=224129 RepID=A0A1W4WC77_AGRPL|nr:facilitated trehalose transporter Tret1-like [Agrilus planipennis]